MENPYFIPTKPATAERAAPTSTYVPGRYDAAYDAEFMPVAGTEPMAEKVQSVVPDVAAYEPPSNESDRQYELDAMANYVLGNEYEECRKKAEEVYGKGMYTTSNEEDRKYLAGRAICRSLYGDDGVPDVYFRENNLPLPSDDKDAMYIAIHDDFREKSRKQYETVSANREKVRQEQERISKDIIRCVSGDRMYGSSEVPPELLQYSENPEQLGASIKRARSAFREFMYRFDEGSLSDFSRDDALKLIRLFSKEDRNGELVLDEDALSLFATAANAKMSESQDGNTHFWRNFGDGLKNAKKGYEDLTYWRSGQGKDWVDIGGGTVVPVSPSSISDEEYARRMKEFEPYEKNRKALERAMGMVDYLNSVGTSTSKDAAWYVKAVNGAGKAFGDTALYFVPSAGWQMAFASSLGNNLNQAAYTGDSAYDALVSSIRETAEEKVAFSTVGQLSALNRVVSRFGLSRIAAKMPMMAKLEGNTAWRMSAEFGMGTLDELALEPMVGEPLEYGLRKGLRAAGFELQDKDFDLIGSIYRNVADEETALGTALFVGIMVGGHGRMIHRQAREFATEYSKSVERLEMAGLKKSHAQELAYVKNDDVRAEKARMYLETDVLNDPVGARERAEQAGREMIDRQEAELYRLSGAIDDVLARNGVGGVEFLPEKGTYKVSYEDAAAAEGEGSARSVEMTGEQLDAYIQLSFEAVGERELRNFTARVFGNALVREAGQANDGYSFLDAREVEELNRDLLDTGETYAGGFVTERGIGALVERAKTAINELVDAGAPMSRALSLDSVVRGVPNDVVAKLQDAAAQRMEVPGNEGQGFASRVWRMRGVSPASSVIAYAKGHANALEVWEDVVESHLASYLADGTTEQQAARLEGLGRSLQEAQRLMKEQGVPFKEFIVPEGSVNAMQVTEAFSSLAQGEEMYSFESWNVPDWVKNMMRFVLRMMNQARDLLKMGEAWSKMRKSGKFDEFKRKHGDLVDLLESSGAKMESIFARARIEAEDSAWVRMAMDEAVHALRASGVSQDQSLADIRRDVEEYAASRDEEEATPSRDEEVSAFDAELELRTRIASGKASFMETAEFTRRFMETLEPGSDAEMALRESGVVQADLDPERRTASQMGAYLGIHAGDGLMQAVRDGSVSGLDAYRICKLTHDDTVQSWALEQMADGKALDFLTPSIQVRDAVVAGVELFDSSPSEDVMEHVADYVRACRASVTDKAQLAKIENLAGTRAVADAADVWIEGDAPVPPLFDDVGISFSLAERESIVKNAQASGTYLKAPNGKDTKLTPEQWAVVRTDEFKQWFGDWEKDSSHASQVVDENGEPLCVYHGTRQGGFTVFDTWGEGDSEGSGSFFTSKSNVAGGYSDKSERGMYTVFLNMRNPLIQDFEGSRWDSVPGRPSGYFVETEDGESEWYGNREDAEYALANAGAGATIVEDYADDGSESNFTLNDLAREARDEGYDGVIARRVFDPSIRAEAEEHAVADDFVIFAPEQIKSATDNRGTFDGGNPDITFSIADFSDISDNWKKGLGDYLDGRNPEKRRDITVCPTPAVLRMIGAKPHDLVITPGVIDKVVSGKHSVSRSAIEQLPSAVSDPICIAVSDTTGSMEIITDLKEGEHHILVAVQLNTVSTGSRSLKVNRITSIYGKEKLNALLHHPMLYWNKTKARVWTGRDRLQLPVAPYPKADSGKKILKPDDLVKWKMKHGVSFSMADMSEVAAMALAPRRGEVRVESLLRGIKANIRNWRELCAATKTDKESAAAVYGQIASVLSEVNRTLPEGYRLRIAPYLRAFEAYSKMIGTGRYYAFSHLKGDEKAEFTEQFFEELDAMMDAPEAQTAISGAITDTVSVKDEVEGRGERKIERIYKEYREDLVKRLAEGRVENMLADMLTAVRGSLESYLKDVAVRKGMAFIDAMMPKKKPSGKYGKGAMAASGYRQLGEYIRMLEADRNTVDANLARIKDELGKTGEAKDGMQREAEFNAEMGDWTMFGCLEEMNLDQARNAMNSLMAFAASERLNWREKEKLLVWQREKMAADMSAALEKYLKKKGRRAANDQTDRDQSHDAKDKLSGVKSFINSLKSLEQTMDALREISGMAPVMNRWIGAKNIADIYMRTRENNYFINVEGMVKKVLGLRRRRDARKWIRNSKKTMETGATVKPIIKKTFEVPVKIAEQWVALWEKADVVGLENLAIRLHEEAEAKGVLPERLGFVYRDEIPALKEAMQSHRDGKYVSFERETVSEDGSIENLRLTKAEAMYSILLYEQDRYRKNFEKYGYTEETMQKLYEFVGEDGLKVAYGLRDLLNTNGEELAAKYEQLTGVPFPKEDNYFHAVWRNDVKNATAGVLFGDGQFMSNGHKYGITVTRRNHNLRLDLSKDAFLVCEATVKEADHYICAKELVDEIRGVLSHKGFQQNLKAYLGELKFNQFVEGVNYLDGAGSVDAACLIATGNVLSSMQSGKALALLSWKGITILKQTSGILNAAASGRIDFSELVKQMMKDRFGVGHFSFADVVSNEAFTSRINRNVEARDIMRLTADRNRSAIKAFAEWGMKLMEYIDMYSNAVSHQALLNATYSKLEAENRNREKAGEPTLSVDEMEELAWREVRASLGLAAQPVTDTQRSLLAQKGGFMTKILTFMAGDAINKFGMVLSLFQRGRAWKALGVFATMSIFEQAVVGLWQLLTDTPGDDDEWKEFYKVNAIGAPFAMLGAIPALGSPLQAAVTQLSGMQKYRNYGGAIIDTGSIIRSINTMFRAMNPDDHRKTWEDGMKGLFSALQNTAFAAGAGTDSRVKAVSSLSSWVISLAAGSNIVKTGMQVQKGAEKRARNE